MINHIDLSSVLRRTVCDLYTDLVTRKTGAAVRDGIEKQLADLGARTLTIIDFSNVGLLDYSCANEIVAKLLMRYGGVPPTTCRRAKRTFCSAASATRIWMRSRRCSSATAWPSSPNPTPGR